MCKAIYSRIELKKNELNWCYRTTAVVYRLTVTRSYQAIPSASSLPFSVPFTSPHPHQNQDRIQSSPPSVSLPMNPLDHLNDSLWFLLQFVILNIPPSRLPIFPCLAGWVWFATLLGLLLSWIGHGMPQYPGQTYPIACVWSLEVGSGRLLDERSG